MYTTKEPHTLTVMLHGLMFVDEDNNPCRETGNPVAAEEYCDGGEDPDMWNVWIRRDYTNRPLDGSCGEPFDSDPRFDRDYYTYALASLDAEALASLLGVEVEEY